MQASAGGCAFPALSSPSPAGRRTSHGASMRSRCMTNATPELARRDVFLTVFLAYFLALTNFFYSQTIPTGLLMLLTVFIITASLVAFNDLEGRPRDTLRTSGVLLLQATPVMVVLFFLFPRVSGPL